jgi:hypothetical protein
MVFDLPFFVSSLPTRPILGIVSELSVSLSATTKGGSKTTPYFGMSGAGKNCTQQNNPLRDCVTERGRRVHRGKTGHLTRI